MEYLMSFLMIRRAKIGLFAEKKKSNGDFFQKKRIFAPENGLIGN